MSKNRQKESMLLIGRTITFRTGLTTEGGQQR